MGNILIKLKNSLFYSKLLKSSNYMLQKYNITKMPIYNMIFNSIIIK